jgi:hypothetical protein
MVVGFESGNGCFIAKLSFGSQQQRCYKKDNSKVYRQKCEEEQSC